MKLFIELQWLILNHAVMWGDSDALNAFHDATCCNFSFGFANIYGSEEKLAVEVGDIDGIHIDDVYVAKTAESEVFEKFAT